MSNVWPCSPSVARGPSALRLATELCPPIQPVAAPLQGAETVPVVSGLLVAAGLAAVHLFGGRLHGLGAIPRHRWLSLAGGVSVAYVFVHLLPELAARQARLPDATARSEGLVVAAQGRALFLVVLAGFATFYGIEQVVQRSRRAPGRGVVGDRSETTTSEAVFWTHVGSFAAYNVLVGYLLVRSRETAPLQLGFFFVAMALHFLVNDFGMRDAHEAAYHDVGRWVLAAAVGVGVAAGYLLVAPEVVVSGLLAFLSGGVVLNVIKEELPERRQSRFGAFAVGVVGYAALLLLV